MIVEAPRWSNAQTVLTPAEAFAPIRHAMRGRRPAYVRNTFPHRGYIWNYGVLPQVRLLERFSTTDSYIIFNLCLCILDLG
jgi:inorganic pyrophosphatase